MGRGLPEVAEISGGAGAVDQEAGAARERLFLTLLLENPLRRVATDERPRGVVRWEPLTRRRRDRREARGTVVGRGTHREEGEKEE
jgi:hypothetical protein